MCKLQKKLDVTFPKALVEYWSQYTNGDTKKRDYGRFEILPHQDVMGIADFFNYYWEEMHGSEVNLFKYDEMNEPLNKEEENFVKDMNRKFFVFATDWNENFMEVLLFDKEHNCYGFVFDQDEILLSYLASLQKGEYKKYSNLNNFITKYINIKIAQEIDGNRDVSVEKLFEK